jgi:hypothetical protein
MRSRAQIPARDSFLLSVSGCQLFHNNTFGASVVNLDADGMDGATDLSLNKTLDANTLLRDMGRSLNLFANDAAGRAAKVAVLREVQVVAGALTEGVSDIKVYLTPVWVAATPQSQDSLNSLRVLVARCG